MKKYFWSFLKNMDFLIFSTKSRVRIPLGDKFFCWICERSRSDVGTRNSRVGTQMQKCVYLNWVPNFNLFIKRSWSIWKFSMNACIKLFVCLTKKFPQSGITFTFNVCYSHVFCSFFLIWYLWNLLLCIRLGGSNL